DTRMITRTIREEGAMRAVISTLDDDPALILERVRRSPSMLGLDLTRRVSCEAPYEWEEKLTVHPAGRNNAVNGQGYHVVVYDFGVKRNILRRLAAYGCRLSIVPSSYPAEDVLSLNPDGIFLSNGPGDPAAVHYAIENVKRLLEKKPIFGICLGHQLLA